MEPWRNEFYASDYGGYYLMHRGRTKGVKNGEGRVYGFRSHTRHAEGQMARAKKENVQGNGRGMEDAGKVALGITGGLATLGGAAVGGMAAANAIRSRRETKAKERALRSKSDDELMDLAGKYEQQHNSVGRSSLSNDKKEDVKLSKQMQSLGNASQQAMTGANSIYEGLDKGISSTKNSQIDLSNYSNKELQDYITRTSLEMNYVRLKEAQNPSNKTKAAVEGALKALGGTITTTVGVLTAVALIKEMKEKAGGNK